jgi:hypothetical protein
MRASAIEFRLRMLIMILIVTTVHHGDMQAGAVMADGPYRYVRNPLYLGGWCMMLAISLLMPPSGALFSMVLLTIFFLRLILGEEAFLNTQLGQPYQEYLRVVPRLIPRLRSSLPSAGNKPHWLTALLTEIMPIGVFVTLGVLAWFYDQQLMLEGLFWSLLASLFVRGMMKAWIPTLVGAAVYLAAFAYFHLNWPRSILIAFGVWLIVRALVPAKKSKVSESKMDESNADESKTREAKAGSA